MDEREELLKKDRERQKKREALRVKREQELRKKIKLFAGIGILVLLILILGISVGVHNHKKAEAEKKKEKARQEKLEKKKAQEDLTVDFLAVGDNIAHGSIYKSGQGEGDVWNYDHIYEPVKKDIEEADLSLVTQETIFVEDRNNVSGYPAFGTPVEIGDALVNAGFDVIAHSSNHVLDKGTKSIEYTLDWWEQTHPEIEVLGIHKTAEEAEGISVIRCKNLKIAMLDYTYSFNGIEMPKEKEYLADLFDAEKARKDIQKAKDLADVVIVVMHVGDEYVQEVDEQTKNWTDLFLEEGVDIVIGSHPHVIRPMETLTGEDGHKMLVYYSLGNFVATQNDLPCLLGGMAKITIRKDLESGEIQIPNHEYIPLLMYYDRENPKAAVYKLEDYPADLVEKHSVYKRNPEGFSLEYYQNLFKKIEEQGNAEEI
ncbi:MAG: CapA family protein [Blautia hansenii]|nr:CapA family protein [Blautia hansenii]MEE0655209.1 CapA family protein [Blautia hansenii]